MTETHKESDKQYTIIYSLHKIEQKQKKKNAHFSFEPDSIEKWKGRVWCILRRATHSEMHTILVFHFYFCWLGISTRTRQFAYIQFDYRLSRILVFSVIITMNNPTNIKHMLMSSAASPLGSLWSTGPNICIRPCQGCTSAKHALPRFCMPRRIPVATEWAGKATEAIYPFFHQISHSTATKPQQEKCATHRSWWVEPDAMRSALFFFFSAGWEGQSYPEMIWRVPVMQCHEKKKKARGSCEHDILMLDS